MSFYRRVEISKKGEALKLIVKNLTEADAGEYMCKVGDRGSKCDVTIEECESSNSPITPFLTPLHSNACAWFPAPSCLEGAGNQA